MKSKLTLDNLTQEQFEQILNLLIAYNGLFPDEDVYLNERCIYRSLSVMNNVKK